MPAPQVSLKIPEIGFIAVTRAALGAGIGFLLADKIRRDQRSKLGWVLLGIGVATTVPLIVDVVRKAKHSAELAA
jgi:hypothetical protein